MERSEFEICMMAVAECRELIQTVKSDLDSYICMKREQSKEENKIVSAAITEGINLMMATVNPDASKGVDSAASTVDVDSLGDSNVGHINKHELTESNSDVVDEATGEKSMSSTTAGEKEIEGIDPNLLEDEEEEEDEEQS